MITITVTKNLVNGTGETDFVKGQDYEVISPLEPFKITEHTMVINEFKQLHKLGNWAKYFKS